MGKSPCGAKVGLKKGPWSPEEDQKLLAYIEKHGLGNWRAMAAKAGLQRCGKSCRIRWRNYLRPDIKRGKFSLQEEQTIIQLHALLGNRWSVIANQLPKRTDNEIKNHWNTYLKKRLTKMGIDPVTHKRKGNALGSIQSRDAANISHLAQWETARLEAEGRLAPKSKPNCYDIHPHVGLPSSAQPLTKATAQRPAPPPLPPIVPPCLDVFEASQGEWIKSDGFFTPKVSLTSPTSTLHFSDDMFSFSSAGFGANPTFQEINCFGNSNAYEVGIAKEHIQNNELEVEGIRVDSVIQHQDFPHPIDAGETIAGSLGFSSFMEDFAGPCRPNDDQQWINQNGPCDHNCDSRSPCGNDLEDNERNYWNHILNSVTFTSGSPVF